MKISRPSPSMVVAGIALFVSLGGTSVAAVNYASRAGSVDGKSAVSASSTLSRAAGKLVATNSSGPNKGRLPGKFLSEVAHAEGFSAAYEVADNTPGAPQNVRSFGGLGSLTATFNDQNAAAGNEDPISVVTFLNQSGAQISVARRVGNGDGAFSVQPNQTAASVNIAGSNTFVFHIARGDQNAIIEGAVTQAGRGTATGTCGIFGVLTQVIP